MSWHDVVDLDFDMGHGSGPLTASPTWVDETTAVRSLTIVRGRSSVRSNFSAGTMTVVLDNLDGEYDPNNTQATNQLKLGTPVRVQATHNAVTYDLFRGHISRIPLNYPMSGKDAVVTVEATENMGILRTTRINTSYSQEATDTRIGNVLDDASWPAGARDLDSGIADVAALEFAGDAGGLIDATVEAEQGQFFIAKNGDATFLNRTAFSSASSQATFDPSSNLPYMDVTLSYDDDLLINLSEVTGADEISATASDSTSITDHGESAYVTSNESIVGEPQSLNVAEWVVAKNKDVTVRVVGLAVAPQEDPSNLWTEVLNRELQDLITVNVDPPGAGDSLSQIVAVESIHHEITPDRWMVSYGCHPLSDLETQEFWILGTSQLGVGTRLA